MGQWHVPGTPRWAEPTERYEVVEESRAYDARETLMQETL
jgi:hypothetical protein